MASFIESVDQHTEDGTNMGSAASRVGVKTVSFIESVDHHVDPGPNLGILNLRKLTFTGNEL